MPNSDTWQNKYKLLCAFLRETGHCRIPQRHVVESVELGSRVHDQRRIYNNWMTCKQGDGASTTAERIAQLYSLGFEWGNDEEGDEWQRQFEQLYIFFSFTMDTATFQGRFR